MKQYVEIRSTSNIVTLGMMQTLLRVNNIDFLTRDEYYIQVDPLVSTAIGGAKILVEESQLINAQKILEEGGIDMKEDNENLPPFMGGLTQYVSKIPFISHLNLELQLVIILSTFFVVLGIVAYFILMFLYF